MSFPNGGETEIEAVHLSKLIGPQVPSTLRGRPITSHRIQVERVQGLLAEFFDGARKLTSHPEFQHSTTIDQLSKVVHYLNQFVRHHQIACPYARLETQEMLCIGAAVCSHKAYLIANMLSEAGIEARIMPLTDHGQRRERQRVWE